MEISDDNRMMEERAKRNGKNLNFDLGFSCATHHDAAHLL
mgnify:CR=1 FL=1